MQTMQKRDSEGVIFCPKCHTKNLSSQKKCGKCGYLFPNKEKKVGEKSDFGGPPQPVQTGFGGVDQTDVSEVEEPQEPQIPKSLTDRAQGEGHLRSIGMKTICKKCGAENNVHVNRCIRCGNKFTSKK